MNDTARRVLSGAVVLVGVGILLYPSLSEYLYQKNGTRAVATYDEEARKLAQEHREALFAEANRYNGGLAHGAPSGSTMDSGTAPALDYWTILDIDGNGMMGYLSIPKISVQLPIYHGTEEAVLQVGLGHLQSTSLPVGGESTHSTITGHRGLPTNSLLTDLDQMEEGDQFYVKVLDQTLAYETDQILTVLPTEMEALAIEPGQDYMTLFTCTPYGINSHRLLVRGHRVPYVETTFQESQAPTSFFQSLPMQYRHMLVGAGSLVSILLLRWGVMTAIRKRQRRLRYYDI
jgi:sortase A